MQIDFIFLASCIFNVLLDMPSHRHLRITFIIIHTTYSTHTVHSNLVISPFLAITVILAVRTSSHIFDVFESLPQETSSVVG